MTRIVILAAGKGTRMDSKLPKVLVPLKGRPMVKYLVDSILATGIDARPIMVVSPDNHDLISRELEGYPIDYVIQTEQLGTGHAVSCAREKLGDQSKNVLVLYGDHPFFRSESIKRCSTAYPESLLMLTTKLPDFEDWRHNFYHWGRIVRDEFGKIIRITEFKDADDAQKNITEVNPAVMCFNKAWLLDNLHRLGNDNKSKEYYLTDLVNIAFSEGLPIDSLLIEAHEAMGINSLEELRIAEGLLD
jgi:bifunctional UDP-N-acetylglucosamine pyrophosphorylase/glucosamine-1-phosphate N-acetyltransferase